MNSFIGWIGGKKLLRKEIVSRFPEKFDRYVEVFGGAGWVLFQSEKHADMEVYNDYNSDLVNLYRCIKYHCQELQRELSYMLNSRELFDDFKAQYNARGMTDIQRAARFFMIIKSSYGCNARTYGCVKRDISVTVQYLSAIQERLSKVTIENKDFENLVKVYDKPDALFYLDPPYYGTEKYYQSQFTQDDHERLYAVLKDIKGKFILSYNDCEYVWNHYENFHIEAIERNNNLTARYSDKDKRYGEVIISNY
ncbi:DNA adenine methylase [Ruminiclostridium herbifermentans]|uniref:site-specific DNA-methyltransferase (adenine-specific) n=1 Tax=Ruminiclostridium herbifermentans TaxID=2488810 RepID=A0A4U7J9L2_9FIRM|nr:Dam family site-specific DNA-(adenine-N6)-methyltransferase [Ruminiclostridium herbifermentans]QNU67279.1 DNA adenine methylase [Ruminiclostridium herbifermentans]